MALDALRSAFRRPPVETPPFAAPAPSTDASPAQGSAGPGAAASTFPSVTAPYAAPPSTPSYSPPRYDDEPAYGFPVVRDPGASTAGRSPAFDSSVPSASSYQPNQFRPVYADPVAGGDTDAAAYACPSCGRTLSRGTRTCDGCGQWLLLDVPMRRAGMLAGGGAVAGVLVTLLLVNVFAPARPAALAAGGGDGVTASGAPGAGGASAVVPAGAAAALRGTTAINGRLAAEAAPLSKALADKPFQTREVVKILRRMAIDTRAGAGMVGAFEGWAGAVAQRDDLEAFYAELGTRIERGLGASVQSAGAYKKAAKQVLATLADIPGLDAQARTLAATAAIELPAVTIPKALR
ncbi:MAG TPA: zinc ribbon domain-containing protein [Candidatus Limnocylindrales bacterium]|nr:zinc ribbon domain-containing protein [Candidatus Limnocylindrales bacterium]